MAYFLVIIGIFLLVVAGDFLVRGSVSLAHKAGVSTLLIGLTIVAFGTSAPELVVGVDAVLQGSPTLALGNVVGSNIANSLLVVGLPALFAPMMCDAPRIGRNLAIMLFATVVFIGFAQFGSFSWPQALILLTLLGLFLLYSGKRAKQNPDAIEGLEDIEAIQEKPISYRTSWAMMAGGLVGLIVGADMLVTGSIELARDFGVSEAVIGLTLIALGTSLPELVTALVAAARGHCDVAVGGVIGSNIFNLLGIVGAASLVGDIPVPKSFLNFDLWVMLASGFLLVAFVKLRANSGKLAGFVMVLLYVGYVVDLAGNAERVSTMGMPLEEAGTIQ